jgi:hypothetical protein
MAMIGEKDGAGRLASAIIKDIELYNADAIHTGAKEAWDAVAEGRALFMKRVTPEFYGVFESMLQQNPLTARYAGGPHGSVASAAPMFSAPAAPAVEPAFICMGCAVIAINPEDGAIAWTVPTPHPVLRMFRAASRLFAVNGTKVHCIDVTNGALMGVLDIGFAPETGMVCGKDLILLRGSISPAPEAIICLTQDGLTRWKGTLAIEGSNVVLRTFGPAGEMRAQSAFPFRGGPSGILYRDFVVQPDLYR